MTDAGSHQQSGLTARLDPKQPESARLEARSAERTAAGSSREDLVLRLGRAPIASSVRCCSSKMAALPAAREERRVGAEEQPIGTDDLQRLPEHGLEREARDGTSSRRCVLEVSRWMFGHWSAAISASRRKPAPKCGMITGTVGNARRDGRERQRIAEPQIERRRQAELLAHADGQHAAVHEHRGAARRGRLERRGHPLVVQPVVVHRRKQADAAQLPVAERARQPLGGVGRRRDSA